MSLMDDLLLWAILLVLLLIFQVLVKGLNQEKSMAPYIYEFNLLVRIMGIILVSCWVFKNRSEVFTISEAAITAVGAAAGGLFSWLCSGATVFGLAIIAPILTLVWVIYRWIIRQPAKKESAK